MSFRKIGISLFSVLAAQQSFGVDWDGGPSGTGTDFNLPANWDGDVFPGSTGTARFTNVGTGVSTLSSSTTVGDLQFDSPFLWEIFSLSGRTLTIQTEVSNAGTGSATLQGAFASVGSLAVDGGAGVRLGNNSSLSGSGDLTVAGGRMSLGNGSTVSGYSVVTVLSDGQLTLQRSATVTGDVVLSGGVLEHTSNKGNIASVAGVSGSGEWLFNLNGNTAPNSPFVDVTGTADIGSLTLNLTGTPSSENVVLASYGTLSGTFASVNGLGPGQYISYNYGPNGDQIALVPEVSLASPLLAAFLPLFALRRRNRRK